MITAIINARCNSSRLPLKHFRRIGEKTVIELIIDELKKNKIIKDIYIASGPYSKNKKFKLDLSPKYKNVKFFFYNKENNVTERIFKLSKIISTEYSVLISGDCVLIDNFLISRMYKKLKKDKNYDFIKTSKRVQHEGIKLFKTQAWEKVNKLSNNKILQENPGYIVKLKPDKFNITKFKPLNYELGKKSRLSIDTKSDLDFFEIIYQYLKTKNKEFSFYNASKYRCFSKFNHINKHVNQKKPHKKYLEKFNLVTIKNPSLGLGHSKRINIIEREINERFTSNIKVIFLDSFPKYKVKNHIYMNIENFNKFKIENKSDYFIFDLPNEYLKLIQNKILKIKNVIFIDKFLKKKDSLKIIPAISFKNNLKENIYSGKKCLILNREINKLNTIKQFIKVKNKGNYLTIGGTAFLSPEILKLLKIQNLILILSSLVKKSKINYFKNIGFKNIIFKPNNILELFLKSKKMFCRFGVTTFEIIALNKIPYVLFENDDDGRSKEINYLLKNKFINNNNKKQIKKNEININQNFHFIFDKIKKFVYDQKN